MTLPRYELKYWCSDETWRALLDALGGLVELDAHLADGRSWYTLTSLYFDTEDLAYYHAKLEGHSKRGKVRLRRYDRERTGFVELKAKKGRQVRKHRVELDAESLATVAHGDVGPLRAIRTAPARAILAEFDLRTLVPSVITRYERAAYLLADDPGVRITLDRSLACHGRELVATFLDQDADRTPMTRLPVSNVLEVKFTGAIPPPVGARLRRLGLECRSISKYCLAVAAGRSLSTALEAKGEVADV